jgi:hypothetical protein
MPQSEIIINYAPLDIFKTFCENLIKGHGIMISRFESILRAYFMVYLCVIFTY